MRYGFFLFVYLVLTYSLLALQAEGAERTLREGPHVFTNEDITKYSRPEDTHVRDTEPVLRKDRKQRNREKHEMEYWCKKASACKKKIKKAKTDVKKIEMEIYDAKTKSLHPEKKIASLNKRLEKAGDKVKDAETDLGELQREANRKGIMPGWLRCQFE